MFDALLASQADKAFYEGHDFGSKICETLSGSEIPFACVMRGPVAWDPSKVPSYPLYSACKSNTEDNPTFVPFKYGTAVLSSVATGEVILRLMREEEGKTPLPAPRPARPVRPGLTRAKTYSVNDLWRTLVPEDFRGGAGGYQGFLHVGDFQSEPFRFEVARRPGQPDTSPYEALLVAETVGGAGTVKYPSLHFKPNPSPKMPEGVGVSLDLGAPRKVEGKISLPLRGTFRFAGLWKEDWVRLPLHILVATKDTRELDLNTLWIPRAQCRFFEGGYEGGFSLDLADLFIAPDGVSKPPAKAWISLVHRDWRGPIDSLSFDSLP